MNKYQNALNDVILDSSSDEYVSFTTREDIDLLQELVDRATPMKPSMSDSGFHTCKCSARVKENDNYCWQCGKALDWSENERNGK